MAMQIPSPVPQVAPQDTPLGRISVNTPEAAFGGATGAAISGLGKVIEGASNELFQRAIALKQVSNEAEAKQADADYMEAAGKLHAEYNASKDPSPAAYQNYVTGLKKARTDIRNRLSNPTVQRLYDSGSLPTLGRTIFNGAGVAATASREYAIGASQARIDALSDQVLQAPDDRTFQTSLASGIAELRGTHAETLHWSPEKTDQEVARYQSKLITLRVQGLARKQPEAANDFLEKNRAVLTKEDLNRAEGFVLTALHTQGAKNIEGEVNADLRDDPLGKDKTLEQRVNEARGKAKKIAPDDPGYADAAVQRTIAGFEQSRKIKNDITLTNKQTLDKSLMGGFNEGGMLPTTVEELTADPQARAAWEGVDESVRRSYRKALTQNAKGDQAWTDASQRRMLYLQGLSQADPREFIGIDIPSEKLPFSAKRALVNMQNKLKDRAEGDPRVTHALQVLRPTIQASGLDPSKDKDRYLQFVGSLQDAMDAYQKENKKLPKADEIQTMGARLLQEQSVNKWNPINWISSAPKMFESVVPEPVANRIKADPLWAEKGITPTDEMVRRIYTREQYQKMFGGSKAQPQVPRG